MKWLDGQSLKPLPKPIITREHLRKYADVSMDKNPIHLDDEFAKRAGFPSVIVHGMLSMAFLADFVFYNFDKSSYRLKRLRTRFKKITLPGDQITCEGVVDKILPDGTIQLTLWTKNQNGEQTTEGEAIVIAV
ncbi:MAG: MaoC family dehydratase N-terminal domain-containing protein [Deltaproteobacteria bacterium]|nr:MaoC family dehydratase N-terminal domain-containing protein [Deltaproteobacteria bacterium]